MATDLGFWLMLAFPVLILIDDLGLKLAHHPTITAKVSSSVLMRVRVILYLAAWTVVLGLHFALGWFDGFPPNGPPSMPPAPSSTPN